MASFGINEAHAITITNIEFNLRLPGQYEDRETGYHYNFHRYYNPETGRYLTPDPIGLEGGTNLYGYADGDPVGKSDPWGLKVWLAEKRIDAPYVGVFVGHLWLIIEPDNRAELIQYLGKEPPWHKDNASRFILRAGPSLDGTKVRMGF